MRIIHRNKVNIPEQRKGGFRMPHYLMQHFTVAPFINENLMEIHKVFYDMAFHLDALLDESPEKTITLRKLLEARDSGVRAMLLDLNNAERDRALKDVAKKLYPHVEHTTPEI